MRIALVGPELEENLGLRYLHSALMRAGHHGLIFSFSSGSETDAIAGRILTYAPHIVGLSMVPEGGRDGGTLPGTEGIQQHAGYSSPRRRSPKPSA